jgi:GNAT superfamily N-acetyltransferase
MQHKEALSPLQMDAKNSRWTETLMDGSEVLIRPIRKEDALAEVAFIEALSPESRRFRFLGQMRHPSEKIIEKLTNIDYMHDVAFVAEAKQEGVEFFVGVSRYSVSNDGIECECAITVLDKWQDTGVAIILMKHLIDVARSHGIKRMWSIDAAANQPMSKLAKFLGFEHHVDPDDSSQVIYSLML